MNEFLRKPISNLLEEENSNEHGRGENLTISNTVGYQIARIEDQSRISYCKNWRSTPKLDFQRYILKLSPKFRPPILLKDYASNSQIISSNRKFLNLFSKSLILQHREEFNYLHVGLVQVAVKPWFKLGLDTQSLSPYEMRDFSNSLLGMVQSNLENGSNYFNCYPNFTLSVDKYFSKSIKILAKGINHVIDITTQNFRRNLRSLLYTYHKH